MPAQQSAVGDAATISAERRAGIPSVQLQGRAATGCVRTPSKGGVQSSGGRIPAPGGRLGPGRGQDGSEGAEAQAEDTGYFSRHLGAQ